MEGLEMCFGEVYLSSKPEEQQSHPLFQRQTEARDNQRK